MHGVRLRVALAGMALVTAAACEPIYMLPGGALSGPEHPAPVDWAFAADEAVVQLETRPADPYSVNLWGVGLGPYYYVSSAPDTKWAALVAEEPRVRLRVDGRIFPLSASSVTDVAEFDAVVAAIVAKYGMDPEVEFPPDVPVFRLEAR